MGFFLEMFESLSFLVERDVLVVIKMFFVMHFLLELRVLFY